MKKLSQDELNEIVRKHAMWHARQKGGERAALTDADLSGANMARANLAGANLAGADIAGANLTGAVMTGCVMPDGSIKDRGTAWPRTA